MHGCARRHSCSAHGKRKTFLEDSLKENRKSRIQAVTINWQNERGIKRKKRASYDTKKAFSLSESEIFIIG